MTSENKEIKHIDFGSICRTSSPCKHQVTITYTDGTTMSLPMNGRQIAGQYKDYLKKTHNTHFDIYMTSCCIIL
jgi:hypothetical protein